MTRVVALIVIAGLLGGCGGGPAAPDPVNVSGTWDAIFSGTVQETGTAQNDDLTMALSQTGTTVRGVLRFSSIEVPIEGQINGNRLTYSGVTSLGPGCEARVDADLTVDPSGTRLNGSQTQATCEGTAVGQLSGTKRP